MSKSIVASLVGISGVGKSALLKMLGERVEFTHLQASEIIKGEKRRLENVEVSSEELRLGRIDDNQALLVSGFSKLTRGISGLIVLDAHMLIDTSAGLVEIPPSVFDQCNVSRFVVLKEEPKIIAERRAKDANRKRPVISKSELTDHQNLTIQTALRAGKTLGVPVDVIASGNVAELERIVLSLLKSE